MAKGSVQAYEIDLNALDEIEKDEGEETLIASIAVRKGKGSSLRSEAIISELDSEWDLLKIAYQTESTLIRELLWAGENAYVIEPQELRVRVITILEKAISLHG